MCMYNRPLPGLGTADDRTLLCNSYNRIKVEVNLYSFRSVRFELLYVVTLSKIV
jgi:hypothetical protein